LREAIINAFVHNDYTNEITPKFEIFADRIEITSAGGLPEGLSKQEFFEGFSVPRNKELMRIFKDLELVEQLGSGIPRILGHYGKESFSFSDNFLRMTFAVQEDTNETSVEVDDRESNQKGGVIGGAIGSVKGGAIDAAEALTKRQKEVLKLIAANPSITYIEIAEALSINESAVGKHITAIKNKGFLVRKGDTRGYWEINIDKN
jgi:predicted HTH transcriptional regulator